MSKWTRPSATILAAAALACPRGDALTSGALDTLTTDLPATDSAGTTTAPDTTGDTDTGGAPERATLVHSFGVQHLPPFEETEPCVQWTLHNDKPIYINATTLINDGGFHHSNWLAVPEDKFPGPDGFFDCDDRGYTELAAAVAGTVVFAQSTQSREEVQKYPEGAVIKLPPRYKIIAGVHLLNLASVELETELRIALDIIHPRDVEVLLTAFRLTYFDLAIPPLKRSRFTGTCDVAGAYTDSVGGDFDLELYHVLPHTHYLGDSFRLELVGGPDDGQLVFEKTGFDASANGRAFDPPLKLAGATGLRFSCGYDNWRDVEVGWGIGDQEMCVMLGLADSRTLMDISVSHGTAPVGIDGDVTLYEGPCDVLAVPKNGAQSEPTAEEKEDPLYVPPTDPGDVDLEPTKRCVDADPAAAPAAPPSLSAISSAVFVPACTFSSCHDAKSPAAGLDLQTAAGLHGRLLGHEVVADVPLALVEPGVPEDSWFYQLTARCDPQDGKGNVARHMPFNAPTLLPDDSVALIREWIAAGALDD